VIDSTFATPIHQKALELGADLVLHSGTKYLAGHNDVMAGALVGKKETVGAVRKLLGILGGVLDPHAAYLLIRGMKTLAVRVERQSETAFALARALERHRAVERVWYPGLESHPDHAVARQQMRGFGGVVSFEVRGELQTASKFVDALSIPYIAPSLGGVESLVEQPTVMSYWDQTPEERARIGIRDNLVRYSCGIEDAADLIADVEQALERI
jgi:cystathionine gamma-synthase